MHYLSFSSLHDFQEFEVTIDNFTFTHSLIDVVHFNYWLEVHLFGVEKIITRNNAFHWQEFLFQIFWLLLLFTQTLNCGKCVLWWNLLCSNRFRRITCNYYNNLTLFRFHWFFFLQLPIMSISFIFTTWRAQCLLRSLIQVGLLVKALWRNGQ